MEKAKQVDLATAAPPDFTKNKFTIEINVLENAMNFQIRFPENEDQNKGTVNIHEVIGVLEKAKMTFMLRHTEMVVDAHKVYLKMHPDDTEKQGDLDK